MRKINLLFLTLMFIFASGVYAQDITYTDLSRTGWTADAPAYSPTDNSIGGGIADARYLLDDNAGTFLALVKPNKTYDGVSGPSTIQELGFVITMPTEELFNYFKIQFRTGNTYDYLRPWAISIYGSNDATASFTTGTWTQIKDAADNDVISLPNAEGNGGTYNTGNVILKNTTAYKYIKVLYEGMSPSGSGSTLQVAEFFVGKAEGTSAIIVPENTFLGKAKLGVGKDFTLAVEGFRLTDIITATLTDDTDGVYTLNTPTLPLTGGTLEINFMPIESKKTSTATLTLTSGSLTESFTISARSNAKYYVGSQWSDDVNGTKLLDMPTALEAEDEVWIAAGEYTVAQIAIPANVAIYGGFAGTESSTNQRAIDDDGKAWEFSNATVLKNSTSLVFSITGANTVIDGITFEGTTTKGRAIQNTSISATNGIIRNCIMQNFDSNGDGGAMNIRYTTEIYNCLIKDNKGNKGGAAYFDNVTIHDCEIMGNSVPTDQNSYMGNTAGGGGGLLLASGTAYNCYISGNTASFGGGAFVRNTAKLYNSIIINNISEVSGSAISFEARDNSGTVYNCIIADNKSNAANGAAVCFVSNGTTARSQILRNSILYNNKDAGNNIVSIGIGGGTVTPIINNNILDKDYAAPLAGTGNVIETASAKLFTDITVNDYTPSTNFAGLNKGDASGLSFAGNLDYAGNARIFGEIIDIGAYESNQTMPTSTPGIEVEANVIDVKYYNLQGVEVSTPTVNGIYIKKELLDTGKSRAIKILFTAN